VARLVEQRLRLRDLDDPAEVHHRHAVTDVPHDAEIVCDEQVGQPELLLEVFHQVENLCLDGDVKRRHRLVGDDEVRIDRECAGDPDPLALPPGEFVWVPPALAGV